MTRTSTKTDASGGGRSTAPSLGGRYLTFHVADEAYAIAIQDVREIIGLLPITAVPQMPSAVLGVVNLRGRVIPVVDLRVRLGLPGGAPSARTCIVVVDTGAQTGLIVDAVEEVVEILGEQIEPPPALCADADAAFVVGLGKLRDQVKIVLDVRRLLASLAPGSP